MAGGLQDLLPERLEGRLDPVPRLRARQDTGTRILLRQEVQVLLGPDPIRDEVGLVPCEDRGDSPREPPDGRGPVVLEGAAALVVRGVVHEQDALGSLDRRLLHPAISFCPRTYQICMTISTSARGDPRLRLRFDTFVPTVVM